MPNTKAKPAVLAIRGDRITAKATLVRQQRDMAAVALAAIQAYLRVVARSVAHTRITAAAPPQHLVDDSEPDDDDDLGPDVDLNGLDQAAAWPSILNRTIMPALSQLITGLGPADRMTPSVVTAISAWRGQYLQGRTAALKGVPDTITKLIRDAIQEDADQHGPNPASASSIVKDLLNPDAPMWQYRAQTIARTEVISANNQGGLASWTAVHQSIAAQGGQVYKTWLATEDQYTRPDHADIDGTEVGVGDTFSVGESVMNGPGEESADPGETINCRCTLTYRVDDGTGDDDTAASDDADADADDGESDDDGEALTSAASEAPVTAPAPPAPPAAPAGPPQPADGTPSETQPAPTPGAVQWEGVLAVLDEPAAPGDSRVIASAGLTVRPLPLPLKYQALGEHGGEMSGTTEIVGRILTAEVRGNQLWGTGDFFDPSMCFAAGPAIEQVAGGIGGISVDLPCEVVYYAPGPNGTLLPIDPGMYMGDLADLVQMAEESELAAATIVDVPAFSAARISLIMDTASSAGLGPIAVTADAASPEGPVLTPDSVTFPDGTVLKVGDQVNIVDALGSGAPTTGTIEAINPDTNQVSVKIEDPTNPGQTQSLDVDASNLDVVESMTSDTDTTTTASGAPTTVGGPSGGADGVTAAGFAPLEAEHVYPADWFEPVALNGPTALTITPEGRVYGHLAAFSQCHIGYADCVSAPSSPSGYAHFHVGEAMTDRGPIPVGKLTVGGGHAAMKASPRGAAEHYDNAGAAVAVVRAHEDEYGIQVTGGILPNATGDQVAALRRSPLSGDWRTIGGRYELVAALSVNVPGFPVPRSHLAASGRPTALVAAGVIHGPAGDGDPTPGGVTLPSGTKLSPDDVAVLASAWHDVIGAREDAVRLEAEKAANVRQLKTGLLRNTLRAV